MATNLDGKNGLDVFISNDVSPNNLLQSYPGVEEGRWTLREEGGRRGVALDASGRAQASMGIACGDVDRNGLPDLIVTNFLRDVNTLYLQKSPGMFVDGTQKGRLHINSLEFLGWGCQLVDLDDDGWLDLTLVNGHIDDYTPIGDPYRMVPQVFRNRQGVFAWEQKSVPGAYFREPALGRALATLDFDRDHKIDFVATHLDRPAALIRNMTESTNHWLELELVGVHCERDAIGAFVTCETKEGKWIAT